MAWFDAPSSLFWDSCSGTHLTLQHPICTVRSSGLACLRPKNLGLDHLLLHPLATTVPGWPTAGSHHSSSRRSRGLHHAWGCR
jgi:hypothetical protein